MDIEIRPGLNVKVEFIDGQILEGKVFTFESKANTESGQDELTITPFEGNLSGENVRFPEGEVKKLQIIDQTST